MVMLEATKRSVYTTLTGECGHTRGSSLCLYTRGPGRPIAKHVVRELLIELNVHCGTHRPKCHAQAGAWGAERYPGKLWVCGEAFCGEVREILLAEARRTGGPKLAGYFAARHVKATG
jgi:hypothetical protein